MANAEHESRLRGDLDAWNRWRSERPEVRPDLRNLKWPGAHILFANLESADLRGAQLYGGSLRTSQLNGANLEGASINSTDCLHTGFAGANLKGADLGATIFMGSDLQSADLSGATVSETVFAGADLSNAIGLANCRFLGASTLDIRTIAKSWPLPLTFLRGCGLPEKLIEYIPSLIAQPIQFYSCFISYSTADQHFAGRLHADLQDAGGRCWFAPHDVLPGKKVHTQIVEAIRLYDKLLLILSPASIASEWVREEILNARAREKAEKCSVLFPIAISSITELRAWQCFDADTGRDVAREIREYFIPDFSSWKTDHDAYQRAFDQVLKGLCDGRPDQARGIG